MGWGGGKERGGGNWQYTWWAWQGVWKSFILQTPQNTRDWNFTPQENLTSNFPTQKYTRLKYLCNYLFNQTGFFNEIHVTINVSPSSNWLQKKSFRDTNLNTCILLKPKTIWQIYIVTHKDAEGVDFQPQNIPQKFLCPTSPFMYIASTPTPWGFW